jgi:hypothetical protein
VKIARVFPCRTNITPEDDAVYYSLKKKKGKPNKGMPDMFGTPYDEIHISCTFTWDIPKALELQQAWMQYYPVVKVGGPAFDDPGAAFTGLYTRPGVTITSRGCPNQCPFCFVPKREGKIRELSIIAGNIVQDNNLLACSKQHRDRVFEMLKTQRAIEFAGGFQPSLVTADIAGQLRSLRIKAIWLAYDHPNAEKPLIKAVDILKHFNRNKLRCYVLIGYKDDTISKATERLARAWEIGTLPFAMLYRDESGELPPLGWRRFQRKWSRPAIYKSILTGEKRA